MTPDLDITKGDNDKLLQASPFAQFLFSQREGKTHTELSEALAQVSEAVLATGSSGTIVLKIVVKSLGHEERLVVTDEVKVTPPKPIRDSSIWFYNETERGLSRRDPRQGELNFEPIPLRPRTVVVSPTDRGNTAVDC